jgi:hypothetical protein
MVKHDLYAAGLFWIIREKGGPNGGWPPRDITRVAGWAVVRMLADLTGRYPGEVAKDLIEHSLHIDMKEEI